MGVINIRELLQFPDGDNATDTVINKVHFNVSALNHFNYTLYSNNTLSNGSSCYLIFDQFKSSMLSNGSWVNGTTCYIPYYGIGSRGAAGAAAGALFGISIVFSLMNLRKHGRQFLREDKRFRLVGRRWQWYWALFTAACGMISAFTGIDVDRSYLQYTPIILQSLFFCLMLPTTLAMMWEAARHWGSWQERQFIDPNPFLLKQDDKRSKVEFWLPLIFYLFAFLSFFMLIPRPWTNLQMQRSPWLTSHLAEPSGTDARLKAGSIIAVIAWIVIWVSLWHSLRHYKPRHVGIISRIRGFLIDCPKTIYLCLIILAVRLAYGIAAAWFWDISLFNKDVNPGWPFGLGYGSTLLIIYILELDGWRRPNEDRALIEQRRLRDREADADLGVVHKPSWWRGADMYKSDEQRMKNLTSEVGGGRPTARGVAATYEMNDMGAVRNRSKPRSTVESATDVTPTPQSEGPDPFRDPSPRPMGGRAMSNTSIGTGTTAVSDAGRPARIRSMLDI